MKKFQNTNTKTGQQVSNKGFHFRLAEEEAALSLSGYKYNAITPFFMEEAGSKLPIILSKDVAELPSPYIWFSGGTIQVKMGISVPDFSTFFKERLIIDYIQ